MSKQLNIKSLIMIVLVAILIVCGVLIWNKQSKINSQQNSNSSENAANDNASNSKKPTTKHKSEDGVSIVVNQPASNTVITSPLAITGSVPGSWSFESTFPIIILDSERQVIANSYGTLLSDWKTDKMVKFSGEASFEKPGSNTGYLVLEKSNPSGIEKNSDKLEIPIRFE